jgi:hypothetical protein
VTSKTDTLATIEELTTAGYARQAITFTAPAVGTSGADDVMASENSAIITFGPLTADPPATSYAFITDAASGTSGTIYARWTGAEVDAPVNEAIRIQAGALKFLVVTTEA